jgi:hypothetical protein
MMAVNRYAVVDKIINHLKLTLGAGFSLTFSWIAVAVTTRCQETATFGRLQSGP